jgi:hypothetical protein
MSTIEKTPLSEQGKLIGKKVTEALESAKLNNISIVQMCVDAGLEIRAAALIGDLANYAQFKKAGKKVAYYVDRDVINKDTILEKLSFA